jgi:predicted GNAT family acetyltransferase
MNHHGQMTQTSAQSGALDVVVTDNPAAHRYEAHIDGELAGLATYRLKDDRVVFNHVEVYPKWERKGVGSTLVRTALDDVVARGKQITPLCPFVIGYVRRHPEYREHIAAAHPADRDPAAPCASDPED